MIARLLLLLQLAIGLHPRATSRAPARAPARRAADRPADGADELARYWATHGALWRAPLAALDVRAAALRGELAGDGGGDGGGGGGVRDPRRLLDEGAVRRRFRGLGVDELRPRWELAAAKRAAIVAEGGEAAWAAELARFEALRASRG